MRRRSSEILQRLLDAPGHAIDARSLLDDYHISEKTLRADVRAIQSFVRLPNGFPVAATIDGKICLAEGADVPAIQALIDEMDLYDYQLSLSERKLYIVVRLLVSDGPLSMQRLADDMYVAGNTVVNDCRMVDDYLSEKGLELDSCSKHGLSLPASGLRQRVLIDVFSEALDLRHHSHDFFTHLLSGLLGYGLDIDSVIRFVRGFFRENSTIIAHEAESEIAACLTVLLNEQSSCVCLADPLPGQRDFLDRLILHVAASASEPVLLDGQSVELIKDTIIERNALPQVRRIDDFDLYEAITHFLFLMGADLGVELHSDGLLVGSLLSHIKSVMEWSSDSFELNVADPSGYMVNIVRNAATPHFRVLERYLNRPLDDGMKASIIIHICAGLYRHESSSRPCNVIVACPASMAMGRYLEGQIRKYFRFNIVATLRAHELSSYLKASRANADFVISTVPVESVELPVVIVAPMLTLDDLNRIQSMVFGRHGDIDEVVTESLTMMNVLRSAYAMSCREKRRFLDRSVKGLIEGLRDMEEQTTRNSLLLSLLRPGSIRVEDRSLDWKESIRLSANHLVQGGYVTSDYVERAIRNVEVYGSYIVVNRGVALAHASHDDGALADGVALLVHPRGIEFDDDAVVHLLFFFSQKSCKEYLGLFREVILLGNSPDEVERICGLKSPELIHQALVELLTDYSTDKLPKSKLGPAK